MNQIPTNVSISRTVSNNSMTGVNSGSSGSSGRDLPPALAVLKLPITREMIDIIAAEVSTVIKCTPPAGRQSQPQQQQQQPSPPLTPSGSPTESVSTTSSAASCTSNNSSSSSTSAARSSSNGTITCSSGIVIPVLSRFIQQLVAHARVPIGTLLASMVYLERLKRRLPKEARGMECTCHRVFLAALIVAGKYFNDVSSKNKYWARYSVVFSVAEVNLMEKQLLALLDYDLRVEQDDFVERLELFTHLVPDYSSLVNKYQQQQQQKQQQQQQQQQQLSVHSPIKNKAQPHQPSAAPPTPPRQASGSSTCSTVTGTGDSTSCSVARIASGSSVTSTAMYPTPGTSIVNAGSKSSLASITPGPSPQSCSRSVSVSSSHNRYNGYLAGPTTASALTRTVSATANLDKLTSSSTLVPVNLQRVDSKYSSNQSFDCGSVRSMSSGNSSICGGGGRRSITGAELVNSPIEALPSIHISQLPVVAPSVSATSKYQFNVPVQQLQADSSAGSLVYSKISNSLNNDGNNNSDNSNINNSNSSAPGGNPIRSRSLSLAGVVNTLLGRYVH